MGGFGAVYGVSSAIGPVRVSSFSIQHVYLMCLIYLQLLGGAFVSPYFGVVAITAE